jgi:ADP-heptose:LPS heptosyltransferase
MVDWNSVSRVLVRRQAALGDVIMTTPIIRRLRSVIPSRAVIDVETQHGYVFDDNPYVSSTLTTADLSRYDHVIHLDDSYEQRRSMHAIDAYMEVAFGNTNWPAKETFIKQHSLPSDIQIDWGRSVVLHPGKTERPRTIQPQVWEAIISKLTGVNLVPVVVGNNSEVGLPNSNGYLNLIGRLSIQQVARVISLSQCFVSADTGMSHVAGTTDTAMVTVYTSILATHRMPYRHGLLGWQVKPLAPQLPCIGCVNITYCPRSFQCSEGHSAVSADEIFEAVLNFVDARRRS